ncbi:transporter substrate-binding domain-containing protein [Desulfopila aestuarii]|uniref:histidine kinase n=1 Tax=Desulfopila aestuarii DSM 18488 TaxID=1121416 RepID=A0A1M7XX47_9BACT|nr:transporter substrate-binding domain-containing protein [Desulfopila aestuarii]SHO43433.1 His Kinase A (phospho-acceptor) domain-containing protein [Desulfopila aestuarii DSM 18488]
MTNKNSIDFFSRIIRYSIALLLCLGILACPLAVKADHLVENHKILKSASELDYPPFAIVNSDGSAGGFSVDLLKAAAEAVGLRVSFKVGPWNELKQSLADGALDVLPLVSYSQERDQVYDFTTSYIRLHGTVFIRKGDSSIKNLSDLKKKEILVMLGDTAHEYALKESLSDFIITTVNYEEAFKLLAAGKHDAIVVQQIVGLQIIKKLELNNIVPVEQEVHTALKPVALQLHGFEQKFCFAVPEGNQNLVSRLNEGLSIIFLDGTYNTLYEKWFAPILPKTEVPFSEQLQGILTILIPLLLLITLFGLWYLKLLVKKRTNHLELEIQLRTKAEVELAEANVKYVKAEELGKVGNWEYNIASEDFRGSLEAKKIFGLDQDTVSFSRPEIQSCIPEKERVHQTLIDLIEHNIPYALEYDIIKKDTGERRTVFSLAELEKDESGVPLKVSGFIQDITDRKRSEEDQKRLLSQLQQAMKLEAIGTLAGGIAHDFNNILGAVIGYAEIIRDDSPAGSAVLEDIEQVLKASYRAKELVKQILAFSKQAGTEAIPLKPAVIVQETVNFVRATVPTTIDITLDLDKESGPILADPTQIHQIVMNLCTNAFHAMEDMGGSLVISLKNTDITANDLGAEKEVRPGAFMHLSVADTGPGITREIRERIFDPYFTTKEIGKGSGLGLSIIHGVVKSSGGYITCQSTPGEGTVFHVFLPLVDETILPEDQPVEPVIPGNECILLVDDEEMLATMGKNMLERLGYQVTTRTNGIEALNTFQNHPDRFDLIITDQTMPGMQGIDLARRVLQIRPDLPVILCTGYSSSITEQKAKATGIKGFAMKPLVKKELAILVRKVLDDERLAN